MHNIGKNIRQARERKGYSQEKLAELLFVTRQTVSNYETGRSRPDVETLVKLSQLLDVEVTDLIYGPQKVTNNRRSLWIRLVIVAVLSGVYLWLTPFSRRCAELYYNKIPEWYRMLILIPCIYFSLGQLFLDVLRRLWKPKPITGTKIIRWVCVAWIVCYCAALLIAFLQLYVERFEYTWLVKCAHTFLGMVPGSGFARYFAMTCAFLDGGGLVLAENEPGRNTEL